MIEFINDKVALGYVVNLEQHLYKNNQTLSSEEEASLFLDAKILCIDDLYLVEHKTTGIIKDITRVHRMFIDDPLITEETLALIKQGYSRGYSYQKVVDGYIKRLKNNPDQYMAERIYDFIDIKYRMLHKMYNHQIEQSFHRDSIVVVETLLPSMVLNATKEVKGFISKRGSHLTHAAIIAKEKGLSYIITDEDYKEGDFLIIDPKIKEVFINPHKEQIQSYRQAHKKVSKKDTYNTEGFSLYLNISHNENIDTNTKHFIKGIGLYRTEHIILGSEVYPTIDKQIKQYEDILKNAYPKVVKMRLFDFSGDKKPYFLSTHEVDAFEFFGILHTIYQEQLEALLIANESYGNLEIMIPMIRHNHEYLNVYEAVAFYRKKHGLLKPFPKLGIMMETIDAFDNINDFKDVGFMSIGSNDLSAELIGITRESQIDYKTHAKAMIEPIKLIGNFCRRNKIEYTLCGDLASNKEAFKKLITSKERNFSIPSSFLKDALEMIDAYNQKQVKMRQHPSA